MKAHFDSLFCRASLLLALVTLSACGGGSTEPVATGASPAPAMAVGLSANALDEWSRHAQSGQPLPAPSADDENQALVGKAARLNRETLEAARRQLEVAGGTARKAAKAFVDQTPVYRFFNTSTGAHFFTSNDTERDHIIATLPQFRFEGAAFLVSRTAQDGLLPVYRFLNSQTGVHLYTISEAEKAHIQATLPHYQLEGVAYHASAVGGVGLKPLYRFYRQDGGLHFFTATHTERDDIINTLCNYRYEGLSYYVIDPSAVSEPPAAHINSVVMVVGDSLSEGYGTSISGRVYGFVTPGKVWTEKLVSAVQTRTGHSCNRVIDVSIGGMRTDHGAARIQGWIDQHAPTHVILAQGTNDAWQGRSLGGMKSSLTTMAQVSLAAGSRVYVLDFAFYPNGTAYRQNLTSMYSQVAAENQGTYVSATASVPFTGTYYHPDDVHLRDAAQPALLEAVMQALLPTI